MPNANNTVVSFTFMFLISNQDSRFSQSQVSEQNNKYDILT